MNSESRLRHIASHSLNTRWGRFVVQGFEADDEGSTRHIVVLLPNGIRAGSTPLIRVQMSCTYAEAFGSIDCDCALQLWTSLHIVYAASNGAVIYLPDTDGRGLGLRSKLLLTEAEEALGLGPAATAQAEGMRYSDYRCLRFVPPVLSAIGAHDSIRLLSNNPQKFDELLRLGVAVEQLVPLSVDLRLLSNTALTEIAEKHTVFGHLVDAPEADHRQDTERN